MPAPYAYRGLPPGASHFPGGQRKNVGWCLDCQVVTPALVDRIEDAAIYSDEKLSDHAPHTTNYDIDIAGSA